jgi:competence protein ComEA
VRVDDIGPDPRARLAALGFSGADEDFVGGWVPEQPELTEQPARGRHARAERRPSTESVTAAVLDRLPPWLALGEPPAAKALFILLVVCLGCVALTGYTLLHHRGQASYAAAPLPVQSFAPLPSPTPPSVVVDVGGRVRRPGLVTLPLGSRVADALRAAGGALRQRDLVSLNLAAKVTDGELLLVGVPGAGTGAGAGGGGSAGTSGPVNLNTATADELDALPGIGPVLAQHILDFRSAHGGFRSVDQLRDVSGIGDSTFADLAPLVTV